MAELAQTYIHLRHYDITSRRIERLGDVVQEFAQAAARNVYHGNVTLDVRLETGSLKSRVTVAGVIGVLHGGFEFIKDYKEFKEGVSELCNDARTFGAAVYDEFTHVTRASDDQIYRAEKRLKAPGKIVRIIKKVETLDQMAKKLRKKEMREQLDSIEHDLKSLERDISREEAQQLRYMLMHSSPLKNLPKRHTLPEIPKAAMRTPDIQDLLPLDTQLEAHRTVSFPLPPVPQLTYHKTVFVPPF